jgi:outer membrane protein assembly factor BamD
VREFFAIRGVLLGSGQLFAAARGLPWSVRPSAHGAEQAPAATAHRRPIQRLRSLRRRHPKATAKKKVKKAAPVAKPAATAEASAEPDKVLYDRADLDLKHGRYTEGRLALQTLINTYPDSEYLAKAKLAVADSYFNEGWHIESDAGDSGVQRFSDLLSRSLTKQPTHRCRSGWRTINMMEKADRDKTQGEAAEDAFQAFLLKYPTNTLAPKATQYLRDVQEVSC